MRAAPVRCMCHWYKCLQAPYEMTRYLELKLKLAKQQQQQLPANDFMPTTPLQVFQ